MISLRIIAILFILFEGYGAIAQTYTYTEKRDWVVGEYQGLRKDSTANGTWDPYTCYINYYQNYDPNDDTTVVNSFNGNNYVYKVSDDSLFIRYWGQYDPNNGGVLFADSTIQFNFVAWGFPMPQGGHMMWFKGKLVQSYVGLKNKLKESLTISVYPNPSPDYINVSFSNNQFIKKLSWDITDITGKQILNGTFLTSSSKINTKEFMDGVYFLNIKSKEGVIYKKFIVQH